MKLAAFNQRHLKEGSWRVLHYLLPWKPSQICKFGGNSFRLKKAQSMTGSSWMFHFIQYSFLLGATVFLVCIPSAVSPFLIQYEFCWTSTCKKLHILSPDTWESLAMAAMDVPRLTSIMFWTRGTNNGVVIFTVRTLLMFFFAHGQITAGWIKLLLNFEQKRLANPAA